MRRQIKKSWGKTQVFLYELIICFFVFIYDKMRCMRKESRILPERMSGALKSMAWRMFGAALMLLGLCLCWALFFHNPYLDGFAAASTFGAQSWLGQIVGFIRFGIGFVPALFVFLCMVRGGLALMVNWSDDALPEYNILSGFIATCVGAAGFGLIVPSATYGGLAGAIVATDMTYIMGRWAVLVGLVLMGLFFVMGGALLHIKFAHLRAIVRRVWRAVRWVLAAFHLTSVSARADYQDEEVAEESVEET